MSAVYLTSTLDDVYSLVRDDLTSYSSESVYPLYSDHVRVQVILERIYLVPFDVLK